MPKRHAGQSAARHDARGPRALWYEAPGRAGLRAAPLPELPAGWLEVDTLWSLVSRGSERLVAQGRVPEAEYQRMRCPMQEGDFPFPVKYGYCAVGRVEAGPPKWRGRMVFSLHPHQSRFQIPAHLAAPVPEAVPARRAVLAANMETALNALWDAGVGPGDRIAIVGAGIVGLLTAALCARLPGAEVTILDIDPARAPVAAALGLRFVLTQDGHRLPDDHDCVFHASGHEAGLAAALSLAGREAAIVEMSWYGAGAVAAPLGGAFHSRRLRIAGTQVGEVAPSRRPRWSHARRLAKALDLLADDRLDVLLSRETAFDDLPAALDHLLGGGSDDLTALVRY